MGSLYLIHQLKQEIGDTGLGTDVTEFVDLSKSVFTPKVAITGGDLLQCISLISNIGHFPDTFAASRYWYNLLNSNTYRVRDGLSAGLNTRERKCLRKILDSGDIYRLHLINSLFLLKRLSNGQKNKKIFEFASIILLEYIENENENLNRYWEIYAKIRNLAYLVLDSSYAPIPFNIGLSSITSNLEGFFAKDSIRLGMLNNSIKQMDLIMQDSVYMEGNSLLATAMRSEELAQKFENDGMKHIDLKGNLIDSKFHKLSVIRDLLEPKKKESNTLSEIFNQYSFFSKPKIDWDTDNCLVIRLTDIDLFRSMFDIDLYSEEKKLWDKCGKSRCRVGIFSNPSFSQINFAYANLLAKKTDVQIKSLFKFMNSTTTIMNSLVADNYPRRQLVVNLQSLIEFCLKNIFSWNYNVTFEWNNVKGDIIPFSIMSGVARTTSEINNYYNAVSTKLDKDSLHEISCTLKVIKEKKYKGSMICYVGATKMWDQKQKVIAEFDGIIIYPNTNGGIYVSIIEGKNMSNGNTVARNQLTTRLGNLNEKFTYQLSDIGRKGAYADVKLKP